MEKEIVNELINKNGTKKQCMKACEELCELQKELFNFVNKNEGDREHILEEYTDVKIMLKQIEKIFLFTEVEKNNMLNKKIKKIKEMLRNGN